VAFASIPSNLVPSVATSRPSTVPDTVMLPTEMFGVPDSPVAVIPSAFISDCVWSAVAPASIPSNFVPSVAISRPSTVPLTTMFPVILVPVLVVAIFTALS